MLGRIKYLWRRLRRWWADLPMTLWVRSLSAQELRDAYRTAKILDVDRGPTYGYASADARRRFRFVERELVRRGLDP